MKYKFAIIPAVLSLLLSFSEMRGENASIKFDSFRVSPKVSVQIPNLPADSVQASKNVFSNDMLILTVNRKLQKIGPEWVNVMTDSANIAHFPKAEKGAEIRTVATRIQPERFIKGNLRLKSNVIANLYKGTESLISISDADTAASWQKANLTLEPYETADLFVTFMSMPDDPQAPEISLEFVPDSEFNDVEIAADPSIMKRFRVDESALGTRVSRNSISPDGKYMILGYSTMYGQDNRRSWSQLIDCATGKVLDGSLPKGAFWLPKGSSLAYTVATDDTYSLYSLDVATRKLTLMASELPENNFTVSPDCSFLILHKLVEGPKDKGTVKRLREPDDRLPGHRNRYYLEKYDLNTGIRQPLTYSGNSTSIFDISPDSKRLIYGSSYQDMTVFPFYFQDIIEMEINTLATDTLAKGESYFNTCCYSPDGKQLFITGGPESFNAIGKNNGGHKYSNDYDVQGYIMKIADKSIRPMTADFNPSIEGEPIWNVADGKIYFRASDGFDLNVYCMDPKTGNVQKIDFGMPYISRFSIGTDENKWISAIGSDYHYAGKCELMDLKSGKISLIDDPYIRDYPDLHTGESSAWSYKASDGTTIHCMQVLPPDFDPDKKYPLIVYYYGGYSPCQRYLSVYDPQIFASRGYVSLVINPSGTYGYGQEFSSRHANAWGDRTADDIIEGVKEYCRTHDFVNDKKIGCLGASYGGFMTEYLQTKTDMFAAAASHAGISNVTSYWGEGNWGYSYNATAAPESYPWNNPDLFTKHGALFNADKIHTPLLLLHGKADTNVPIGESIQLFNALSILGRDVEFVQVDGENHIISNHDKRRPWHSTIMAWFAKHLQDDPRWWEALYGD